jgi:hypothetical protein
MKLLDIINEVEKPVEPMKSYDAVFVGGLTTGESLDTQTNRLATAIDGDVKGFSYADNTKTIIEFLKNHPRIPVFVFSAGCMKSNELANCGYVNKKTFFIIEPTYSGGETTTSVRGAVSSGVPARNVFVGSKPGRGLGIVDGASTVTAKGCHYCAISTVGSISGSHVLGEHNQKN